MKSVFSKTIMLTIIAVLATGNKAFSYVIITTAPYAAILDCGSGTILFERNANEKMFPSSMSKLMTLYVAFSKLKSGAIKATDIYETSDEATKIGGSTIFLKPGQKVSVKDLINGIVIASGNDASIVLAEGASESKREFIEEMNDTARRIGMRNSNFTNVTGWPDPDHYTTPLDLLILSKSLMEDFPEYVKLFSQKEITFNHIKQKNRNSLLWTNAAVNGLKTGYTESGGYGMVVSGSLDNRLVIIVVNGLRSESSRHKEISKLLDYAFNSFESRVLFEKHKPVQEALVWMGKDKKINLVPNEDILITYDKKNKNKITASVKYHNFMSAPIIQNQKLGTLIINIPNYPSKKFDLIAEKTVEPLPLLSQAMRRLSNIFSIE